MDAILDRRPVQLIDLAAQQARVRERIDAGIAHVLDHGQYIMGPEVRQLEHELAMLCGAQHAVTCANGTDALVLALRALGVQPGDGVIVPSFTFCATAEAVCLVGAVPLFVDVLEDTFNMDPASLVFGIERARRLGLPLKGVVTVDLFGQPCDYGTLEPIIREHGLFLICDAAQAFGATCHDREVGSIGDVTTTSFFPAKPLGCYGDGGAVLTDDADLAAVMRSLRVHGQGKDKYDNVRIGTNSRLDTLQAAILLEKLAIFPDELTARQRVAERYGARIGDALVTPTVLPGCRSAWAQYTVRVRPGQDRDGIMAALKERGVPTAVYYSRPLHLQTAYTSCPQLPAGLPVAERLAREVFSLPMHPYLDETTQDRIVEAVIACADRR